MRLADPPGSRARFLLTADLNFPAGDHSIFCQARMLYARPFPCRMVVNWNICCLNHAHELNVGSFKNTGQFATMRRKTPPFGGGMTETRQMENEVRSCKGVISEADQLPSVSWSHTDKRSEYEALKKLKDHASGEENEALSSCSLNIRKWEEERAFSPGKFCKCLLVRGTTSFCKGNCNFFAYWRE